MTLFDLCTWLENSQLGIAISESENLFPIIETVHVFALAMVFGSIAMLDLRLLGLANRGRGVMQFTAETLPWTWGAFIIAAISGLLMFISQATGYYESVPFRIKLVLLALAGVNMVVFHVGANRSVQDWDLALPAPQAARISAGLSLTCWIGVVIAGRWMGFV